MPKYYLSYTMLDVFTFYTNISYLELETIYSAVGMKLNIYNTHQRAE